MTFLTDFQERADAVTSIAPLDVSVVASLPDDDVIALLTVAGELAKTAEKVRTVAAGVIAARSTRDAGHGGLAQVRGHRNAVALIQDISGSTRGDAARHVRLGQALLETAHLPPGGGLPVGDGSGSPTERPDPATEVGVAPAIPWHAPVDQALLSGVITGAQMDAIIRGLGQPPLPTPGAPALDAAGVDAATPDTAPDTALDTAAPDAAEALAREAALREMTIEAWRLAGEQLVGVASEYTVEDLATTARGLRDRLDPEGAEARFLARHEARSFRTWIDADGIHHARITFCDEGAAWVRSVIDAALRPRRGGPRFVDPAEAATARDLAEDPRSNDQLTYDLILDLLHAGAVADAESVFGARQPGVRLVSTVEALTGSRDGLGRPVGVGHTEDTGHPLPAPAIEQAVCTTGHTPVTVDVDGNPLDVGREQRLFTPRQRIALAVRDGGCMWPGCGMVASYTEAHHIDQWAADTGRTDIDRGILLCRFHHMNLHHHGHRITRAQPRPKQDDDRARNTDGTGPFVLHPPDGPPVVLASRSPLRWLWNPPPRAA